jgi:hypothetical protein
VIAGHLLVGFHGCDATTRDDLVSGRLHQLDHSNNRYDWLDNAVFTFIHHARENGMPSLSSFLAVRGAFHQGPEIVPKSGFHRSTHVQLALRDNTRIVGWFLPPGAQLLLPDKYQEATARRLAMEKDRKPRRRTDK